MIDNILPVAILPWLSILIFCIIIVGSGLIGLVMGWKSSLYFLIGNLIFGVIGIFIYELIYNHFLESLIETKIKTLISNKDFDISPIVNTAKPYFGSIFMFIVFLIANLILGILYIFLRKWLKIKKVNNSNVELDNKRIYEINTIENYQVQEKINTNSSDLVKKGHKNSRFVGMILSLVTGFIISLSVYNTSIIAFDKTDTKVTQDKFTIFANDTFKALTFNKLYKTYNIQKLITLSELLANKDSPIYIFDKLFNKNNPTSNDEKVIKDNWNNNFDKFQGILGDKDIAEAIVDNIAIPKKTLTNDTLNVIDKLLAPDLKKLNVDKNIKELIKNKLGSEIQVPASNPQLKLDIINKIMGKLFN